MRTYAVRSFLLALAVNIAFAVAVVHSVQPAIQTPSRAVCDTDTDCLRLCDLSDDLCNGGPQ